MSGTRIWRFLAAGALVISMLAASPAQTVACSCGGGGPYGNVAFEGQVIVVVKGEWVRKRLQANKHRFANTVALLAVDRQWLGPRRPFYVVVGSEWGEADCMLNFVPGASYTIHGREKKKRGLGPLATTICDGSYQMDAAE
jgi:hypothetical protein